MRTISPVALTVEDRDVRPLTADEALRMVDAGILGEHEPVQLPLDVTALLDGI